LGKTVRYHFFALESNLYNLKNTKPIVLFVEDSPFLIERVKELISEHVKDCCVFFASTRSEAIQSLKHTEPDLIFLDINLPDGNGIDILKWSKYHYPNTKVVMVSNHSNSFYRGLCESLGAICFLDKSKDFEKIPFCIKSNVPGNDEYVTNKELIKISL
jgi:DNA-binding NarL/FixJ family response regulator